jgi:signal transduction histidine kinase/HD-like signal output (HDOD) protein
MSDIRDKRVEMILQQLEELPTLPAVAVRVLQLTGEDSTSSSADVVRVIGSDPALSARILQLTYRVDRGVRDDVKTIERAVSLLGFDAVRNAVLAVAVFQALAAPNSIDEKPAGASDAAAGRFSREGFWTHSLAVACCAELLCELIGPSHGVSPSEAFLCGLLHDLGKLALDVALPKSYARVVEAAELLRGDIADLERTVIGVDHHIAGKRLAERWQLPAALRDVVWLHGQAPKALPAAVRQPLINLITLADLLVRQQHLGYSGNYRFAVERPALLEALGISSPQADKALASLVQRMEPRSAALGLGQTTSDELYRQALEQANRELHRVGGQLAAKTKRLSQKSQFFDGLHQFNADLRNDAAPQQALATIAASAAAMLGAPQIAAFSLSPANEYAEAMLCDAGGAVIESALVDLPGHSSLTDSPPLSEDELRAVQGLHADAHATAVTGAAVAPLAASPIEKLPASSADKLNHPSHPSDGPVLPAGDNIEWLTGALSPRLAGSRRFWICLAAEGSCIGGVVWGADAGESERLAPQAQELAALGQAWSLALRMAQVREATRSLAEELAQANRRLSAAQDVFLRTRSLTTVGEMAAGAAHEMNNPLAVISGRSQLLARQLSDPKQKAAATLIYEQSDRLSGIITEMMAFAKPQPPSPRLCDVASIVSAAVARSKERAAPADRKVTVNSEAVPQVFADSGQLSAALTEMIDNAIQATESNRGAVAVQAAHDPWSGQIVVSVSDEGCGMDEATLKRAFDPFYSSKPAGRRRGLGLSKAMRWVEASGGSIRLESTPGRGTRATMLLPVAPAGAVDNSAPRRVTDETKPPHSAADEAVSKPHAAVGD